MTSVIDRRLTGAATNESDVRLSVARSTRAWWSIARRDVLEHLRSIRFITLCLLTCLLLPLGAFTNAEAFRVQEATADALRVGTQNAQNSGVPKFVTTSPISQTHENMSDEGLRAVRFPSTLGVLAVGYDRSLPSYWQFEPRGVIAGPPLMQRDGLAGLSGDVDFVFITQIVLGLLALLLSFDAISGEKESGTLRLLMSYPVPRVQVLIGKYLGGVLTLAVPLALGAPLALLTLQLSGVVVSSGEEWLRVAIVAAGAMIYLACMFGVGLAVSAATRRSRTSLVILLVIWVVSVLVLPRVAALAAATARAVESEDVVHRRQAAAIVPLEHEREKDLASAYARITGGSNASTALSPSQLLLYGQERAVIESDFFRRRRDIARQVEDARERRLRNQQTLARALIRLSPSALFGLFAMNVLGTGDGLREGWSAQIRSHQRRLEIDAFDKVYGLEVIALNEHGTMSGSAWSSPQMDDLSLPRDANLQFTYVAPPLSAAVLQSLPDIVMLLSFALLGIACATTLFLRYDPR
jgi:ABC-type transport system involved in multi-copper enzyme maturation permease subunit